MEPSPLGLPRTPNRATSEGPSPPSRNPMEDADSSVTRKRPRLDSGDRAHRSMSADRILPTRASVEHGQLLPAADGDAQDKASLATTNGSQQYSLDRTPSKVTINVRDSNLDSSPLQQHSSHVAAPVRPDDPPSSSQATSSPNVEDATSGPISATSSPAQSPEIEVAEIEDMDEDPGQTKWRPLVSVVDAGDIQATLLDSFPYAHRFTTHRQAAAHIAQVFEKGSVADGLLFRHLAEWIEAYLEQTSQYKSQWWSLYTEAREFWEEIPMIAECLLRRSARFDEDFIKPLESDDDSDNRQYLEDFLVAFTALAARMAQIDHQTLEENLENTNVVPDLVSPSYLNFVCWFLVLNHFWKVHETTCGYAWKSTAAAVANRFVQQPLDGVKILTRYVDLLLQKPQIQSALISNVWVPLTLVIRLTSLPPVTPGLEDGRGRALWPGIFQIPRLALDFFKLMNSKLETFISKQVPSLTLDISKSLVTELSVVLRNILNADDELADLMLPEDCASLGDLSVEDRTILTELAWKFRLLRRCIMEGRMEIRVQGVDAMQQELVNVYHKYIAGNKHGVDHKVVQYLSDFILSKGIVEYMVGVESHPQLITRSSNIVGFLVVTRKYTEGETDAIWKAVTSSQDARTIDAILSMLSGIFNIATYPLMLYLCEKLNELPTQSFDNKMIQYSKSVLDNIRAKWRQLHSEGKLDMPPYHLCIRLIREATSDTSLSPDRKREIYHFALTELHLLTPWGPSDADRRSIYDECVADISAKTPFATGSISAVIALLGQNPANDIRVLAAKSNLTSLIVEEFAHVAQTEPLETANHQNYDDPLSVRLELLQQVILHIPISITRELGQALWNSMLGDQARNDHARDAAWAMLVKATHGSPGRNVFIDQCVHDYLPQLNPRYFTLGMLSFAQAVILYESHSADSAPMRNEQELTTPGGELLWHLALVSPDNTIEARAIQMLVSLYLDGPGIRRASQDAVVATHTRLVERCIHQLIKAASKLKSYNDGTSSGEDESMVIVASERDVRSQKLCFVRSLFVLKEFLDGIRCRTQYSPPLQKPPGLLPNASEVRGETVCIRYQPFSGGTNTGIQMIEVGDLETIEELMLQLIRLTGFSKFTAIAGGQKLDLASCSESTIRDVKLDQKGLLLLRKAPDAETVKEVITNKGLRPLEVEVMKHFDELYDLLAMEDKLGKDVLDFLKAFPPHETVTVMVCVKDSPLGLIFPLETPFKVLYSIYALRTCLEQQLQNGTVSQELIVHGVQTTAATLTTIGSPELSSITQMEITMSASLVDCLQMFLKEPVPLDISAVYFADAPALITRLCRLIAIARTMEPALEVVSLIIDCFRTILETSLHSKLAWTYFKDHESSPTLLRSVLLETQTQAIREGVSGAIQSVCGVLPMPTDIATQDFVSFFWETIVNIIPHAVEHQQNSQQLFDIALVVFRSTNEATRQELPLATYVHDWSDLLLNHNHDEFVGRGGVDWIVSGFSGLLHWCIQLTKSIKKPLNLNGDLMEGIFRTHLFPDISEAHGESAIIPRVPILHSATRQKLYAIILALSNDLVLHRKLLGLVMRLLPQGEASHAWSWGIAQILEEYHYEANWNFERLKSIRSPTGYPGLKNLSNTCYLNSLFTQLFMNVSFRGFMLNTNIAEAESSQKLLSETKRLFAYMQESWLRSVDPQGIADSVINYENTLIDVSVQMDVDEFYNLLFDRWESQILSEDDKRTFRKFYGGQIVQQIKSKECPHISERLEPFSAIQCDIQGKTSLTESLNAYVGGEVMEGDNKYSCTSCGCYVDAVKRACLKDIPDNLIFHLKRFDYDVMTGMRSKINDHFAFPEEIDMSLYDVEHLKDPEQSPMPDMFNLVGVLVHSGNAESGHYYSYIRERPVNSAQSDTWVEYNDADVTRFNPGNIPDQCFGGLGDSSPFSQVRFPKVWSAYMLFYQRTTAMVAERQSHVPIFTDVPVKESLPLDLGNRIAVENETWIRRFCLFDLEHAKFAKSMLEQLRNLSKGTCSDDHAIEGEAIWLALDHVDQILSRAKDYPEFDNMLESLSKMTGNCTECCKLALDWVAQREHALRNLLLRCPTPKIRDSFSAMILKALSYLREHDTRLYGFEVDGLQNDTNLGPISEVPGAFHGVLKSLKNLWTCIQFHSRAWDDYFKMLWKLADLGSAETFVLLREGFLERCLEILTVEHYGAKKFKAEMAHYSHYLRLLEKGRKYSIKQLVELVSVLLSRVDLEIQPLTLGYETRPVEHGRCPLTKQEDAIMRFGAEVIRSKNLVFLDKILSAGDNQKAARNILRIMVRAESCFGALPMIFKTITGGINIEPAELADPYLDAALIFCECCPTAAEAKEMIGCIAREVDTIGNSGGKEHLNFFACARRLRNDRLPKTPQYFQRLVLVNVPSWAPPLLMYPDFEVQEATVALLQSLVFNHDIQNMDDEQRADEIERTAKDLCRSCLKRIRDHLLQPGRTVDSKLIDDVVKVVRHCIVTYFQQDASEDDQRVIEESDTILEHLLALAVSDADDALSDAWDDGSNLPTDSESELVLLSD